MDGTLDLLFVRVVGIGLLHFRSKSFKQTAGIEAATFQFPLLLLELGHKFILFFVYLRQVFLAGLPHVRKRCVVA